MRFGPFLHAGGANEGPRIAQLEAEAALLHQQAESLQARCTPRPLPPQYLSIREEVHRFVGSFGDVHRVLELLTALASRDPGTAAVAASQAAVWQENAGSWVERLGRQFESGYRDMVQPVQLAVLELQYGLALMQGRAALASLPAVRQLAPVLSQLLSFPCATADRLVLDAKAVQSAVAAAISSAALQRWEQRGAAGPEGRLGAQRAAEGAGAAARLQLLRVALHHRAIELQSAQLAGSEATASQVAAAQLQLHVVFSGEMLGLSGSPSTVPLLVVTCHTLRPPGMPAWLPSQPWAPPSSLTAIPSRLGCRVCAGVGGHQGGGGAAGSRGRGDFQVQGQEHRHPVGGASGYQDTSSRRLRSRRT